MYLWVVRAAWRGGRVGPAAPLRAVARGAGVVVGAGARLVEVVVVEVAGLGGGVGHGGVPGPGPARGARPLLSVARRHGAVVRRPRAVVQRRLGAVHRRPRAGRVVHRRAAGAVHRRPAVGGEGARVAAHPARVDHGDAAPVHGDGLALGVQLHPRSRVGGVLHDADVSLVRALRDLDGLPHELPVPAQAPAPPSAPPPAAVARPHVAAPLPALAWVGGARQPRAH